MTKEKFSQADMDAVSDNPELTDADIARAKPFAEVFPDLAAKMRVRGEQKAEKKVSTTIRLSPEVLSHYRAQGRGWQARIDEDLRKLVAAGGKR